MYFEGDIFQGLIRSINKAICCGCKEKKSSVGIREAHLTIYNNFCCNGYAPPTLSIQNNCCANSYEILNLLYLCCENGSEKGVNLSLENYCCDEDLTNLILLNHNCCNKNELILYETCCIEGVEIELNIEDKCCENDIKILKLNLYSTCCTNS